MLQRLCVVLSRELCAVLVSQNLCLSLRHLLPKIFGYVEVLVRYHFVLEVRGSRGMSPPAHVVG